MVVVVRVVALVLLNFLALCFAHVVAGLGVPGVGDLVRVGVPLALLRVGGVGVRVGLEVLGARRV